MPIIGKNMIQINGYKRNRTSSLEFKNIRIGNYKKFKWDDHDNDTISVQGDCAKKHLVFSLTISSVKIGIFRKAACIQQKSYDQSVFPRLTDE